MSNKVWTIFISSLYILYILFILPWYFVFILFSNSVKRLINKRRIGRELRRNGIPRNIRRIAKRSYKNSVKIFTIKRGIQLMKLRKSNKEAEKLKLEPTPVYITN